MIAGGAAFVGMIVGGVVVWFAVRWILRVGGLR